ncbi:MAG: hypothetical protein GY946_04155 [bacterium]|nr:hypothetical protein [bacterium]
MRTRELTLLSAAVLLVAALLLVPRGASEDPRYQAESGLFPAPSGAHIAALVREIAEPTERADYRSLPIGLEDYSIEENRRLFNRSSRAVRELGAAGPSATVDETLLAIARKHAAWDSRCRAALALTLRRNGEAAGLLMDLVQSKERHIRYVAWNCSRVGWAGDASPAITAEWALEQYGVEPDEEVAREIEAYLGVIRAKAAVPVLMDRIRNGDPASATTAAYALGRIGAVEAIPLLIASSQHVNQSNYLMALGRIGTPAAVKHLLENLDAYGAADGLVAAGDRSVVPALEKALATMRARPKKKGDDFDEREIELAILQLKPDDPSSALMDVIEDGENDDAFRESAAAALRRRHLKRGTLAHQARLAAIYLKEEGHRIRQQCASALEDSRARGVTEAMLNHAVTWNPDPRRRTAGPEWLIWHLNRRLGSSFQTLDDVKQYVEKKRATN